MPKPQKQPERPPSVWLTCDDCGQRREDARYDKQTKKVLCNHHWQLNDPRDGGGREPPYIEDHGF